MYTDQHSVSHTIIGIAQVVEKQKSRSETFTHNHLFIVVIGLQWYGHTILHCLWTSQKQLQQSRDWYVLGSDVTIVHVIIHNTVTQIPYSNVQHVVTAESANEMKVCRPIASWTTKMTHAHITGKNYAAVTSRPRTTSYPGWNCTAVRSMSNRRGWRAETLWETLFVPFCPRFAREFYRQSSQ